MKTNTARHRLFATFRKTAYCIVLLIFLPLAFTQEPPGTPAPTTAAPPHRLLISEVVTSSLILQRIPAKYPEAALNARIQGTVVLRIVIDSSGAVQDLKVVSGDPTLADAATQAVRQWRYKPYRIDDAPVAIETLVTLTFHLQPQSDPAPLGDFRDEAYFNPSLNLYYPFSRDWVRETELIRKRYASEPHAPGSVILLVEVHIPQDNTDLRADTAFTLLALNRSPQRSTDTCPQYLAALANEVQTDKKGKQQGDVSQFTIAGRDFYRANFEFRGDDEHHATICSPAKEFLLLWNIKGVSNSAIQSAISTLNTITDTPAAPKPESPADSSAASQHPTQRRPVVVHTQAGVSLGLLIKKVQPVYPRDARQKGIQGTVRMRAEISKTGDIVDLELIDGPIELAVSAVNAVRQWKYKPYLLNGEPVAVSTEVVCNYTLTAF